MPDAGAVGSDHGEPETSAGAPGVSGRPWIWRAADGPAAETIARQHGLPDLVARALAARGVAPDAVPGFLAPRLRDHLPDPSCLADMDRAADVIAEAIRARRPIAVWADYDADGATAGALLLRFIEDRGGAPPRLHVPDRLSEGYGLNAEGLCRLAAEGTALVIAVDCGSQDRDAVLAAREAGLDLVVIDHHPCSGALAATALVNPNRCDGDPTVRDRLGGLAAVGVTFLVLVAADRALRRQGAAGGDLMSGLDLVALGTVCDVVPLTGLNRALVAQGLKVMARRARPGLAALADAAGLGREAGRPIEAGHLGFALGPRINAGGRLGQADLGARLLASRDPAEAGDLAAALEGWNGERKAVEHAVMQAALAQVPSDATGPEAGVVAVAGDGWHPGVVGIVAGRLKERFQRPALVIGWEGDTGRGSARSIPGFDIGAAIAAARAAGLVEAGGGHPMAAGCTVRRDRFAALSAALDEAFRSPGPRPLPPLAIDAAAALSGLNDRLAEALAALAPFGSGNPEPRLLVPAVRVAHGDVVGGRHVRCRFADERGGGLVGIAFRAAGEPLGDLLLARAGAPLDLVGTLQRNTWQGRTRVELVVEDARPVWQSEPGR